MKSNRKHIATAMKFSRSLNICTRDVQARSVHHTTLSCTVETPKQATLHWQQQTAKGITTHTNVKREKKSVYNSTNKANNAMHHMKNIIYRLTHRHRRSNMPDNRIGKTNMIVCASDGMDKESKHRLTLCKCIDRRNQSKMCTHVAT